ncbi:MAG TPA: ethanolamine permease [Anaerovoracaceae bacterium]|nr:ethanolamine permease [Anaerovoracaceae bacterium]
MSDNNTEVHLKKVLKPIHLWAIAVGLVISGQYYGFSYGFATGGPVSFLVAFIPVTIMYVTFLFCYTELATSIPHAGGPSAYARKALGPFAGFITGFSVLIAFLVAPCAVAITTGALVNYLIPAIPAFWATVGFFCFFVLINLFGVKSSSVLELVVTLVSLAGLVIYAAVAAPHFESSNFFTDPAFTNGFSGVAGAMTYAMWFYFAIDGAAMQAEEMENPRRDIPKGYIPAIITLFIASLIALFLPAGIADYMEVSQYDYPLAKSLELALGAGSVWPKVIAFIALFSMVASFSAIVLAFSRQTFAMGRTGYLPPVFARLNKWGCPTVGLVVPAAFALALAMTGQTAIMVTISVFAALIMYIIVIITTFVLRKKEPNMDRPFKVAYPIVPVVALITVILLFVCVLFYNIAVLKWVLAVYAVAVVYYLVYGKKYLRPIEEEFNLD